LGNVSTNPISYSTLISKIHKELKKLITKKQNKTKQNKTKNTKNKNQTNQPNKQTHQTTQSIKCGIELNQEFTSEEPQMAENHLKNVLSP
jgi:outer membrane receptor for monomeric catechols